LTAVGVSVEDLKAAKMITASNVAPPMPVPGAMPGSQGVGASPSRVAAMKDRFDRRVRLFIRPILLDMI
jgi:hypothetical protein